MSAVSPMKWLPGLACRWTQLQYVLAPPAEALSVYDVTNHGSLPFLA